MTHCVRTPPWLFSMLLVAAMGEAQAQDAPSRALPTENVTVTSEKAREAVKNFVAKLTAPTRLTGKLGRWDIGICPSVAGLKPEFGSFIIQRVRETATRVGAPINSEAGCRPNIHIAFTTTPQALLTNIRNTQPYLLGYADSEANKDRLAIVTSAIQAWYFTQTRDQNGKSTFDTAKGIRGEGRGDPMPGMILPSAFAALKVTGGRLGDGVRTVFDNIIIAADPNALLDHEMGTVADHVAMLALAQTEPLTDCPALPSILNLFTPGCAARPGGMTAADEGYLRGLYSMNAGATLHVQRDQMVHRIGRSMEGR
jgi:hypothetical protein